MRTPSAPGEATSSAQILDPFGSTVHSESDIVSRLTVVGVSKDRAKPIRTLPLSSEGCFRFVASSSLVESGGKTALRWGRKPLVLAIKGSIPLAAETVEALKDKFVTNPEVSIKESRGPAEENGEPAISKVVVERNQTSRLVLSRLAACSPSAASRSRAWCFCWRLSSRISFSRPGEDRLATLRPVYC